MRRWVGLLFLVACSEDNGGSAPAPIVCAQGQQVECTCPGGDRSVQTCNVTRTGYDVCACGPSGAAGGVGNDGSAGSMDAPTLVCQPGVSQLCIGTNACNGFQRCDDTGMGWLDCQCLK